MREILHARCLPQPRFRYSQVVKAGPNYYCSGMLAQDRQSGELVGEGPGEQTSVILANLEVLMSEFDLCWEDLVLARIYCTRLERFAEVNAAWEAVFDKHPPPARTSIGVQALPLGALVEIEFQFYAERWHKP